MAKWEKRGVHLDLAHYQKEVPEEEDFTEAPGIVDWIDHSNDANLPAPAIYVAIDRLNEVVKRNPEFSQSEGQITPIALNIPTSSQRESADILRYVFAQDDVLMAQLHDAVHRPDSQSSFVMKLDRINDISKYLGNRAYSEIAAGNTHAGLRDLTTAIRLPGKLGDSIAGLPSILVEVSALGTVSDAVWACLQVDEGWDDASLAKLEAECRRIQFTKALPAKVIRMIAWDDTMMRESARAEAETSRRAYFKKNLLMHHIVTFNELFADSFLLDPKENALSTEFDLAAAKRINAHMLKLRSQPTLIKIFTHRSIPNLGNIGNAFLTCQQSYEMAVVACQLKRHHLKHGEFPTSLEGLGIELPKDLFRENAQIQYQQESADGFKLYSVGFDEIDDGGDSEKDVVWHHRAAFPDFTYLRE